MPRKTKARVYYMIAFAVVNWSRWVAECPHAECFNAMRLEYGQLVYQCRGDDGCGYVCPVQWPGNWRDIERLLADRPIPATRNWRPPETLHDLVAENLTHGVTSEDLLTEVEAKGGGVLYAIIGDELTIDIAAALGAAPGRLMVGSNS